TTAVLEAFESAGFEMKLRKNFGRAAFHGQVKKGAPEFLAIDSAESGHYGCITSHLLGKDRLGLQSEHQQHLTAVLASAECYGLSGDDDGTWIRRLYTHLLGRLPDPGEFDAAMQRLRDGYARQRQALASRLVLSTGYEARVIASYYTHFL